MMNKLPAIILITFLVSGCSIYKINSEDTAAHFYPEKSIDKVIYIENISRAHEVVGFVTVKTERSKNLEEVLLKMKREAAILGGDAITNIQVNSGDTWKKLRPKKLAELKIGLEF